MKRAKAVDDLEYDDAEGPLVYSRRDPDALPEYLRRAVLRRPREAVGRLARGLAVGALCKAKVGEGDMPVGVEEHLKGDNVAWIARASSHARRRCYVGWLYVAMNDAVIVEVR